MKLETIYDLKKNVWIKNTDNINEYNFWNYIIKKNIIINDNQYGLPIKIQKKNDYFIFIMNNYGISLSNYLNHHKLTFSIINDTITIIKNLYILNIVHGDIHLFNFIINKEKKIRLIDFGLASYSNNNKLYILYLWSKEDLYKLLISYHQLYDKNFIIKNDYKDSRLLWIELFKNNSIEWDLFKKNFRNWFNSKKFDLFINHFLENILKHKKSLFISNQNILSIYEEKVLIKLLLERFDYFFYIKYIYIDNNKFILYICKNILFIKN